MNGCQPRVKGNQVSTLLADALQGFGGCCAKFSTGILRSWSFPAEILDSARSANRRRSWFLIGASSVWSKVEGLVLSVRSQSSFAGLALMLHMLSRLSAKPTSTL